MLVCKAIVPLVIAPAKILPLIVAPVTAVTSLPETIVPENTVPLPIVASEVGTQNTFLVCAPLASETLAAVVNDDPIWNVQTALALPPPSSTRGVDTNIVLPEG